MESTCTHNCDTCPNKGKCGSGPAPATEQNLRIANSLKGFGRVLLVLSGKGGVGKSTVATQLAFYLADKLQKHVGLMDIDICGPSIPTMTHTVGEQVHGCADGWMPIGVSDNLQTISIGFMLNDVDDAVIMRGPKKHATIAQFLSEVVWDVDPERVQDNFLIIDTPPGTTDEHLSSINLITSCSLLLDPAQRPDIQAIIVSTPQEVALADVRKEINFCAKIHIRVSGVIENMSGFVCPCCGKETQIFNPTTGGCAKMCESHGIRFLGRIPLDAEFSKAGEQGKPWSQIEAKTAGVAMFEAIVAKIVE